MLLRARVGDLTMATLPSPEVSAKTILSCFSGWRGDDVLMVGAVYVQFTKTGGSGEEYAAGIRCAIANGWIDCSREHRIRLTVAGEAAIKGWRNG